MMILSVYFISLRNLCTTDERHRPYLIGVNVSPKARIVLMTVTINLPQNVEQAYLSAAQTKGVSVDALLTDVLVSHVPATE